MLNKGAAALCLDLCGKAGTRAAGHTEAWSSLRAALHLAEQRCFGSAPFGQCGLPLTMPPLSWSRQSWHRPLQCTSSQPVIRRSGVVTTSGEARMAHILNSVRYSTVLWFEPFAQPPLPVSSMSRSFQA